MTKVIRIADFDLQMAKVKNESKKTKSNFTIHRKFYYHKTCRLKKNYANISVCKTVKVKKLK